MKESTKEMWSALGCMLFFTIVFFSFIAVLYGTITFVIVKVLQLMGVL